MENKETFVFRCLTKRYGDERASLLWEFHCKEAVKTNCRKKIILVKYKEKGEEIAMRVSERRNRNPEKMSDLTYTLALLLLVRRWTGQSERSLPIFFMGVGEGLC